LIGANPLIIGVYDVTRIDGARAARLSALLGGPRILVKRDDMTGLAFGGNKTRNLEYLMGDAMRQGADTVFTSGAPQSNHCRQTAAATMIHDIRSGAIGKDETVMFIHTGGTPAISAYHAEVAEGIA